MMRISMSISDNLLMDFDDVLKNRGYNSRSKGIRDALNDYIARYKWINEMEGRRFCVISVVYALDMGIDALGDLYHDFREIINLMLNFHIGDSECMDVIIVDGDINNIRNFNEKLMRMDGVVNVKFTNNLGGDYLE